MLLMSCFLGRFRSVLDYIARLIMLHLLVNLVRIKYLLLPSCVSLSRWMFPVNVQHTSCVLMLCPLPLIRWSSYLIVQYTFISTLLNFVHVLPWELPLFYGQFIFVSNLSKAFPYSSDIILLSVYHLPLIFFVTQCFVFWQHWFGNTVGKKMDHLGGSSAYKCWGEVRTPRWLYSQAPTPTDLEGAADGELQIPICMFFSFSSSSLLCFSTSIKISLQSLQKKLD
jgi:hypothetical protein